MLYLGFSKIRNFNGLSHVWGQCASTCQIASKSVKRLRRYGDLTVFTMSAFRHLGFWKFNCLTVWTLKRPILHNHAKFREDLSIHCCDIAICLVFEDNDRRHFFEKLKNFNGLSPAGGQSASVCQISAKSVKWLLRYGGLTVFFQNGGRPPSWICRTLIGTTHEDNLVVFIVVLKLV